MNTPPEPRGGQPQVIEAEIVSGPQDGGNVKARPPRPAPLRALGWILGTAGAVAGAVLSLMFAGVFIVAALALLVVALAVFAVWRLFGGKYFIRIRR
ncbi:MAG: hypothetical protein WC421_03715 [Elusimicrobiales bacterium]